jgi:hypothetical protein
MEMILSPLKLLYTDLSKIIAIENIEIFFHNVVSLALCFATLNFAMFL